MSQHEARLILEEWRRESENAKDEVEDLQEALPAIVRRCVEAGMQKKDIAKIVDVDTMNVTVTSVSFREKEADATVSFTPKQAPGSQPMVMSYALERKGDEWKIKSRSMLGAHDQVQGEAGLPPGHPGASSPGGGDSPKP